jgi:PKD repeat protein
MLLSRVLSCSLLLALGLACVGVRAAEVDKSAPAAISLTEIPTVRNKEGDGNLPPDQGKDPALFINKAAGGKPLIVGSKTYDKGLMALHGTLSWSYNLDGKYVGLSAELGQVEGGATIRMLGDGKPLYDSGLLPVGHCIPALVDLRGVKDLQVVVLDTTASVPWNDHVVIGNPRLTLRPLPDAKNAPGAAAGGKAPSAVIAAGALDGVAPFEAQFTGEKSTAPGGQVMRYTWYFGDGNTETLAPNPKHTYTDPGLYEVLLQVEDDKGGSGIARELITVRAPDHQPPVAAVAASARLTARDQAVTFDATKSVAAPPDSTIKTYAWDFGDGQSGSGATVEHAFKTDGRYAVTLTVTDNKDAVAKRTVSVKVTDPGAIAKPLPLQKGARVLLLGNSLIGFSGPIDEWLVNLDKVSPQPLGLVCESRGKGMAKLDELATWERLAIHDSIDRGWDVVIIQPWIDATDPKVSDEYLLKHATTLVKWIRAAGAYPVFYEPQFGWMNFDAEQAFGHKRIKELADKLDAGFIPAGQGWVQVEKNHPLDRALAKKGQHGTDAQSIDHLLYADFGHQNFSGGFFNALMIWKYLTGQSPLTVKVDETSPLVTKKQWDGGSLLEKINWKIVPELKKIADETITPGAQKAR